MKTVEIFGDVSDSVTNQFRKQLNQLKENNAKLYAVKVDECNKFIEVLNQKTGDMIAEIGRLTQKVNEKNVDVRSTYEKLAWIDECRNKLAEML